METLRMSARERGRLQILGLLGEGKLSQAEAAERLGLSVRQVKRLWRRFAAEGDGGVVHQLRGRPSNHRRDAGLHQRVVARYVEAYADYGPTLAAEMLAEEGLVVGVETLRRWLQQAGLWSRQRQRKQHRSRRARRARYGELVQMDGSHHDWFEGRRREAVLMVMIDDATGRVFARFYEEETFEAACGMLLAYAPSRGLPQALYVDRAGIYRCDREATAAEILAGKEPQTQFGRALATLGVELILARSPQAKGRVERVNRTLQDRLLKALRRAGISDLTAANRFLEDEYLAAFNARFGRPAAEADDAHRAVTATDDLSREFAIQEERVVQNDWTVRWRNGFLQLPRASGLRPKSKVLLVAQGDGRVRLFAGERELTYGVVRTEAARPRKRKPGRGEPTKSSQGRKPSATHPWRGKGGAIRRVEATVAATTGVGCGAPVATLPALRPPPLLE